MVKFFKSFNIKKEVVNLDLVRYYELDSYEDGDYGITFIFNGKSKVFWLYENEDDRKKDVDAMFELIN